ncbi:PREDICTED: uncharacterized protein LOC109466665 [Branchiostoma belcheri]|uniref:Uncharacterized protein LOC109466665 n=1 Tax=Branchiostoma belcheri TaxID=7741 RepID=A0A6P4YCR6_BRABE|nr:PREDICTED: uncharacterized protein LOC109466665 [Branchiostoma belcheri]
MAIKLMAKTSLLLLMQLLVPCVDAGSWQSCREVSVARCGVGDSRSDGHEYRYDIGAYRHKWTKYPLEVTSYRGPFDTVPLFQPFQSCQVCSNETRPTQGGPTQNPSPYTITNIMIVGNNVGKLGIENADILSKVPCSTDCRLWFVGCNLTAIELGAFAKLPQVSELVIWRSNVQTLKNGTFAGMGRLENLLLLENNITRLEDGCFHGLPRLSYLILVDNQILTMSPGAFLGVQPRWVDVSANLIATVAPGTLQAIKSVEYVRVVENKLRSIGVEMFYGLERLRVVNLEGNRISHIAEGAFHSNTLIGSVNLAGNRLTFLSGGWFKSSFPHSLNMRGNDIAAMATEGRALPQARGISIWLGNLPRCTCANDWLYEHKGNTLKIKQQFIRAIMVRPPPPSCPASPLPIPPAPVNPNGLPCPVPLVEVTHVECSAAYRYEAAGDVYWEQLPTVTFAFPDGVHHTLNITYDTHTTTHDSLPTGNLTVRVVTDLKAEGWVKCKGPENLLGQTGNHSLCSNYMGRSSFTLWLETAEPLSFGNTTCTASSETGSDTAVFAVSARTHSDMTTLQVTELTLLNTTPFSVSMSTTPLSSGISTTPMVTSTSDDADLTWYIVWAALGGLSAAAVGVWVCALTSCIKQKLKRNVPDNIAGPSRDGHQIAACSMWPLPGGNSEESVISPYAEGRLEDHDSFTDSESVISPYAEGGFNDHPDLRRAESSQSEIAPYGLAKLCPAYRASGRPRARTHPVPSRPYSTERPRQKPKRAGAVLAAYDQNGRDKSDQSCYKHPSILPNPGATKSSAYQQNASAAQRARKAPCYNSPALATNLKRTLSNTYDQHDPSEAVCNSAASPMANTYQPAASPGSETGTQSAMYDENHPGQAATGEPNRYVCPSPTAGAGGSQAGTYCQNDRREAVNNTPENPETNSYEPA